MAARQRDQRDVARFVERFAAALTESGMPRTPARVFVCLLATDEGGSSAEELAERLQVSRGGISNAVRELSHLDLISREREPGSRRDRYTVHDDVWYEAMVRRERLLSRLRLTLAEGVAALGQGTPAGDRLAETVEFFEFLDGEMPRLIDRWREHRKARAAGRD